MASSDLKVDESSDVSSVSYDEEKKVLKINKSGCYTISCDKDTTDNRIEVTAAEGKVFLTLNGVNVVTERPNTAALNVVGNCDIVINVKGRNKLSSGYSCAGLQKDGKGKLTIQGSGVLDAVGGCFGAGIGGGIYKNGENITIENVQINAQGGIFAAGIGGGAKGAGLNIYIKSGKIVAQGGILAAGIGGGANGTASVIHILGGSIGALGGRDCNNAERCMSGIGGGYGATGDEILIKTLDIFVSAGINADNINLISGGAPDTFADLVKVFSMKRQIKTTAIAKPDENGTLVLSATDRVHNYDSDVFYVKDEIVEMCPVEGPIFSSLPNVCDPLQRVTGDCIFMSLLISFAKSDPEHLIQSIRDNQDGTVTVRFYDQKRQPCYYRIKKTIPKVYMQGHCAVWPAFMEKAFACHNHFMQSTEQDKVCYDKISQHSEFNFTSLTARELEYITNETPVAERVDALSNAFSFLTTQDDCVAPSLPGHHCFAILKAECSPFGLNYLVVRDPHGDLVPLYALDQDPGGNLSLCLSSLTASGRNGIFIVLEQDIHNKSLFDFFLVKRYKR